MSNTIHCDWNNQSVKLHLPDWEGLLTPPAPRLCHHASRLYNVYPPVATYLYESDVGPLVAAADLVEGEEVRTRSLQKLGVKLVTDVIDHDNGRLSDERLFLWVETENRPGNVLFARLVL